MIRIVIMNELNANTTKILENPPTRSWKIQSQIQTKKKIAILINVVKNTVQDNHNQTIVQDNHTPVQHMGIS